MCGIASWQESKLLHVSASKFGLVSRRGLAHDRPTDQRQRRSNKKGIEQVAKGEI